MPTGIHIQDMNKTSKARGDINAVAIISLIENICVSLIYVFTLISMKISNRFR